MSANFKDTTPLKVAEQAERDLNSNAAKKGHGADAITDPTGVDESVTNKFPGSTVEYGTGGSLNRTIPESEGGSINPETGKMYKQGDFARGGVGAPEAVKEAYAKGHGGEDGVESNTK